MDCCSMHWTETKTYICKKFPSLTVTHIGYILSPHTNIFQTSDLSMQVKIAEIVHKSLLCPIAYHDAIWGNGGIAQHSLNFGTNWYYMEGSDQLDTLATLSSRKRACSTSFSKSCLFHISLYCSTALLYSLMFEKPLSYSVQIIYICVCVCVKISKIFVSLQRQFLSVCKKTLQNVSVIFTMPIFL